MENARLIEQQRMREAAQAAADSAKADEAPAPAKTKYYSECIKCGRRLTRDECGLHKKLINRGSTEFMCIDCLSEHFKVPVPKLRETIEHYRASGCLLFN